MIEEQAQAPLCKCECGKQVKWNKQYKRWNKFIYNHHTSKFQKGRIAWNKGLTKETDERLMNLSILNTGKKLSEEHKRKISISKKGCVSPMKGKHHTEETKRKISESKIGEYAGELSSNWKGGISCEPYCQDWTKEYKEYIKERDGNKCLNPVCRNNCNHLTLEIHHIDYNKKNCVPQNLLTLCKSCNARANFKREYWQQFYEKIIKSKYNIGADT